MKKFKKHSIKWKVIGIICMIQIIVLYTGTINYNKTSINNKKREFPAWFRSNAKYCGQITNETQFIHRSQQGEDKTLLEDFFSKTMCNGTYVELGALNGVKFSNTFLFNQEPLNWKGILIEASPRNYEQLVKFRKNEIATVHAAVCEEEQGDLTWVEVPGDARAISGFYELAAPSFRDRWWKNKKAALRNARKVPCRPLTALLKENLNTDIDVRGGYWFDFFSLDVEGAELSVLKSLDFDKFAFGIIFVEADHHDRKKNEEVVQLLKNKGYTYLFHKRNSNWFQHPKFETVYKNIIIRGT